MTLNDKNIFWIGGSPCCGKSTISEMFVSEYGWQLFKCDDHMERYIDIGASGGDTAMEECRKLSLDEYWLRDVDVLVKNEFQFYHEMLRYAERDIYDKYTGQAMIIEGVALLPAFVHHQRIAVRNYVCMVPTKKFQLEHYSKRDWVDGYLSDCLDKKQAYANWMERDAIFAKTVLRQAEDFGLKTIVVDGDKSIVDIYLEMKKHFGLIIG